MIFAKWVFTIAGAFGVIVIAPLFFLEDVMARSGGPFNHPETYYGFAGAVLAWQFVYLVIGRNPAPYRPIMLLGALGKVIYATATWVLLAEGRIPLSVPVISSPDILFATLFVIAWFKTRPAEQPGA